MKKQGILNSHISKVLADLGHTDYIVVADVGLPIPQDVLKIDLSLQLGEPSFEKVVQLICEDMVVEKVIIAQELENANANTFHFVQEQFSSIPIEQVKHEQFKQYSQNAKAIIRTGEAKPFANCILISGVNFGQ